MKKFLTVFLVGISMSVLHPSFAKVPVKSSPPNIIFVFVDDMGFGDLGCYGNRIIKTPNLDRMAMEGSLSTNFTVASLVCSPSRVGIMTGQYPSRLGFHGHLAGLESNKRRGIPNYLDPDVETLTKILHEGGYVTGHFGKWHHALPGKEFIPMNAGSFDYPWPVEQ